MEPKSVRVDINSKDPFLPPKKLHKVKIALRYLLSWFKLMSVPYEVFPSGNLGISVKSITFGYDADRTEFHINCSFGEFGRRGSCIVVSTTREQMQSFARVARSSPALFDELDSN